ncbi:hypothetical protein GIB67_014477 [Kingdonia uniflora]|uniref:Uncharacterized protein n=1 Tax=Kingdonia uniflora TaxID=39325 RepID=A0A7J7LZ69_9MAGN|nr:hypothetical protein GIB67_014477 [Kingdonia uniflora]
MVRFHYMLMSEAERQNGLQFLVEKAVTIEDEAACVRPRESRRMRSEFESWFNFASSYSLTVERHFELLLDVWVVKYKSANGSDRSLLDVTVREMTVRQLACDKPVEEDAREFDWEAAVQEIDVACGRTTLPPSTTSSHCPQLIPNSNSTSNNPQFHPHNKPKKPRQSTLDSFIVNGNRKKPIIENQFQTNPRTVEVNNDNHIGGGGGDGEDTGMYGNVDLEAAKTWIYPGLKVSNYIFPICLPVNIPRRDYQLSITNTALFTNTLVALPTGLGKTLIAAVVMYNYFRWFPEGKIVFTAPSRPLVMQQIEACHNIVGIPQEWTIDMTGQTSPSERVHLWKAKRVFFVTPQVLEKDIQSGTCLVKQLVCLVIDEAHRALGNYSYCVAIRELMAVPVELRVLALTATPGSKQETIQSIISNLHISKLEYRNESDHDVSSYVHNRKLELIEVAMGQDAVEVNNILLKAIQPFVTKLDALDLLPRRDPQTLSPCDFLASREKFRQAPPPDLSHITLKDVDGYFGVLISLYHIRKLLSSHGIRPAYDMLEEKLRQGFLAKYQNELMRKAKQLMQQSLSAGASSPKLLKMIEILVDHFKTNSPENSRVIIFSNFRGSVRNIMDSLSSMGEVVRPTEFIGQSSGKSLKGQNQKVQQAVLQQFRAGGYNVIVATSIGEEGLDIMEVGLVICFDANVSSLRMIQRMGRTGRKNDGRVDILLQQTKQYLDLVLLFLLEVRCSFALAFTIANKTPFGVSNSKSLKLRSSVLLILACEGSELKGYLRKEANNKTICKHMRNGGMNSFEFHSSPRMIPHICKPELQFVEFSIERYVPRGKKVKNNPMHKSTYTDNLSDAETKLMAAYFPPSSGDTWKPSLIAFPHFQTFPSRVHKVMHSFRTGTLIDTMQCLQGLSFSQYSKTLQVEGEMYSSPILEAQNIAENDRIEEGEINFHDSQKAHLPYHSSSPLVKHELPDFPAQYPPRHFFLYGGDFASVNSLGTVSISFVPSLPVTKTSLSFERVGLFNNKQNLCPSQTSPEGNAESDFEGAKKNVCSTPCPKQNSIDSEDIVVGTPDSTGKKVLVSLANEPITEFECMEMSPRLTNMAEEGVVPESPICETHRYFPEKQPRDNIYASSGQLNSGLISTTPLVKINSCASSGGNHSCSPIINEEIRTPLVDLTNSCSKDWHLSSGESSKSVQQVPSFRRLRKFGESVRRLKESLGDPIANLKRSTTTTIRPSLMKHKECMENPVINVNGFIEEEAEVSADAEVSDDEEEGMNCSFDDSFIDDRVNPTAAGTEAEASGVDMMAIYRRSLLSQSPMEGQPHRSTYFSPDILPFRTIPDESGSCSSGKISRSSMTPGNGIQSAYGSAVRSSVSCQMEAGEPSGLLPGQEERKKECRKRKLSFCQVGYETSSLQPQRLFHSKATHEVSLPCQVKNNECNGEMFYDDQFYDDLDLDALEAQATKILSRKLQLSQQQKQPVISTHPIQNHLDFLNSPSFDLGI